MGTPRALDPISGFYRKAQYIGVELFGSIELVRDDLNVVDSLKHYRFRN